MNGDIIIFRGGGDVATGSIQKVHRAGFRVLVLETAFPTAVRRMVAVSECIFEGTFQVEDLMAVRCEDELDIRLCWEKDQVPVVVDPKGTWIEFFQPKVVVDAIIAKKNLGTNQRMAPMTIALGPGFYAGIDVDIVIETDRGHNLARLIFKGEAFPNTGNPGNIMGYTTERVLYSPVKGIMINNYKIGDIVCKDDIIATVDGKPVKAKLDGVIRGLIRDGTKVSEHMKVGDIDPRKEKRDNCFTISDKARAIGGATLEAIMILKRTKRI